MKLLLSLTCLCLAVLSTIAQDTIYYNSYWRDTTAAHASYYRTRSRSGGVWQVIDHYLNGKSQMTGAYLDDSCLLKQGEFIWFDSIGRVTHECTYVANKEEGKETYYYDNGKINITGNNKNGEKDGKWLGYYTNGQRSGEAKYKNGKQVSGTFYHEDGSRNKDIEEFMRESGYPGGVGQWLRFLNKNLRYPDSAYIHEIEGTVVVQFIVSEEGKPLDCMVIQAANPYLDAEAKRVILLTKNWEPAIFGGRLVKSYKKQPIVFKLQTE
ncbi:MAG TPA: TonB family protein [Puia sp.]|nr:TonB family protein [Puia sp.]